MSTLLSYFQSWSILFSDDPILRTVQIGLIAGGVLLTYLVFYTTRDIVLRTKSFRYQAGSILMVAVLPVMGFLFYLLVRPSRTIKEREVESMLRMLVAEKIKNEVVKMKKKAPKTKLAEEISETATVGHRSEEPVLFVSQPKNSPSAALLPSELSEMDNTSMQASAFTAAPLSEENEPTLVP